MAVAYVAAGAAGNGYHPGANRRDRLVEESCYPEHFLPKVPYRDYLDSALNVRVDGVKS